MENHWYDDWSSLESHNQCWCFHRNKYIYNYCHPSFSFDISRNQIWRCLFHRHIHISLHIYVTFLVNLTWTRFVWMIRMRYSAFRILNKSRQNELKHFWAASHNFSLLLLLFLANVKASSRRSQTYSTILLDLLPYTDFILHFHFIRHRQFSLFCSFYTFSAFLVISYTDTSPPPPSSTYSLTRSVCTPLLPFILSLLFGATCLWAHQRCKSRYCTESVRHEYWTVWVKRDRNIVAILAYISLCVCVPPFD